MMADHFIDDEAQKFLGEVGIEIRVCRKLAQAADLPFFPARIGGRKARPVSQGKKIQVSCDTSVMKVSTSGRPLGLA